jgi:hypothetical protein
MLNPFTKAFRAARKAEWRQQHEAIEKACSEARTTGHYDALLGSFEARDIGYFIEAWADEAAYHSHESTGIAMIKLENGAVVTKWADSGFWDVSTMSEERASEIIAEAHAEWNQEEEEEA